MKIKLGGLAVIIGVVLLLSAFPVHGQTINGTINFTGITNSNIFGDGYVDPYAGSVKINGVPVNPTGLIVCDDFNDNIYIPETWNVTAIKASTLSSTNIGATLFGSSIGLNGYAAVADLVSKLLSTTDQSKQADLSAAIWYITSGGIKSGSTYSLNGTTLDPAATGYVIAALGTYGTSGNVASGSFTPTGESANAVGELYGSTNLWVLTPSSWTGTSGPNGGRPQEMWADPISAPEGGAALLYLLLAGGVCFGAMVLNRRNRFANLASA